MKRRPSYYRKIRLLCAAIIFTAGLFAGGGLTFSQGRSLFTLDDKEISYKELVSAPKTILFVWTTSCPLCQEEMASLAGKCSLAEGTRTYYVNLGEDKRDVEAFLDLIQPADCMKKDIVLDYYESVAYKHSIFLLPTVLFFQDGKLVDRSNYLSDEKIREAFGSK